MSSAALLNRIDARQARIAVLGQGYVGLPLAMRACEVGFPTIGYDVDRLKVDSLQKGKSYISDVSDFILAGALACGYSPTWDGDDLDGFDIAIITVPTPLSDGRPDLSFIESAALDLVGHMREGVLVVLESTTYPGTTEEILRVILEKSGLEAGVDFFLGYSPERIDPGNPNWTLVNTPKVVSGIDEPSLTCVESFYGTLVDTIVPVNRPAEAELTKLIENTFRHVNVALVNEIARFAADLGIDIWAAIDAASTKPFGYMRFTPGPGVGGHCLPIDPQYLAYEVERRLGERFQFIGLANEVNRHMADYVVARVTALLNSEALAVRGSRILVLGLAYKAGTSDWRESPSSPIVDKLLKLGADLRICDPRVARVGKPCQLNVPFVACTLEEISSAALVLLLVDHPDYPYDAICEHAPLVFDAKGVLRGRKFRGEVL